MTDLSLAIADLPEWEQRLILRSSAHVVPDESRLPETLHFREHVTELDAARLIHAIERGVTYVPSCTHDGWASVAPTPGFPYLSRVVRECLRLGLVRRVSEEVAPDIWRTTLVAAPVHLAVPDYRAACSAHVRTPHRRLRLSDDLALVDCMACRAQADE